MFKIRKLNARGVAHHFLVMLIVVTSVAGVGAYEVSKSHADVAGDVANYTVTVGSDDGCWLVGRVWSSGACQAKCRTGAGTYSVNPRGTTYAHYCPNAIATNIEATTCIATLHRMYVQNVGCARRTDQTVSLNNAHQCTGWTPPVGAASDGNIYKRAHISTYPNYVVDYSGATDKCIAIAVAPTSTANQPAVDNVGQSTGISNCALLGRTGTDAACNHICQTNRTTSALLVGGGNVDYCTGYVYTSVGQTTCISTYFRRAVIVNSQYVGCASRVLRDTAADTTRCAAGYGYYVANITSGVDKCFTTLAAYNAAKAAGTAVPVTTNGGTTISCSSATTGVTCTCPTATPITCACKRADQTVGCNCTHSAANSICLPVAAGGVGGGSSADNGCGDTTVPAGAICGTEADVLAGNFVVNLYKQVNFGGSPLTLNKATTKLPSGWAGNVKSYRIIKGRWQICDQANYKMKSGKPCPKPWASNPNLISSKKPLGSLQPATINLSPDAANDPIAHCTNANAQAVAPNPATNVCPAGSPLACPVGYVVDNGGCLPTVAAFAYRPVDKSFVGKTGERNCELVGREWIHAGNGGDFGCSLVTCNLQRDGVPRGTGAAKYCVNSTFDAAYAVVLSKATCKDLGRIWIVQAGRCAQVPNRKDKNQTIVKAKQCSNSNYTYYIYRAGGKHDECFSPTVFQRAKGVVKATGGGLSAVLHTGPQAYCKARSSYHWNNTTKKCIKNPPSIDPQLGKPPVGDSWDTYCASLYRQTSGHCSVHCIGSRVLSETDKDSHGYRKCVEEGSNAVTGYNQIECQDAHKKAGVTEQKCGASCETIYVQKMVGTVLYSWYHCPRQTTTPSGPGSSQGNPKTLDCLDFRTTFPGANIDESTKKHRSGVPYCATRKACGIDLVGFPAQADSSGVWFATSVCRN
jgi:hypothetical protein